MPRVSQDPLLAEFGARLFRLRKRIRKLSQEEVALRLGVDPTTVGRWEAGGDMPLSTALRLCDVLKASPAYLFGKARLGEPAEADPKPSYFIDNDAVASMRAIRSKADVHRLLDLSLRIGLALPAHWTEVDESEYQDREAEARQIVGRFGRLRVSLE